MAVQFAANLIQDHVLGGPMPTAAEPSYKHRVNDDGTEPKMKALAWFGNTSVDVIEAPIPDISQFLSPLSLSRNSLASLAPLKRTIHVFGS